MRIPIRYPNRHSRSHLRFYKSKAHNFIISTNFYIYVIIAFVVVAQLLEIPDEMLEDETTRHAMKTRFKGMRKGDMNANNLLRKYKTDCLKKN